MRFRYPVAAGWVVMMLTGCVATEPESCHTAMLAQQERMAAQRVEAEQASGEKSSVLSGATTLPDACEAVVR